MQSVKGKLSYVIYSYCYSNKMMEFLSETMQDQVVEHMRDYIEGLKDRNQWDLSFKKTQQKLAAAAQRAKQEIANGHAKPMDHDRL